MERAWTHSEHKRRLQVVVRITDDAGKMRHKSVTFRLTDAEVAVPVADYLARIVGALTS